MRIKVKISASNDSSTITVNPQEDFGLNDNEWDALSDSEKEKLIMQYVFDLPEQPFWVLDSFCEK